MNFKENKPIYLQIADRICDEILQGRYAENDRIPSVRDYAATVEVNANTAMPLLRLPAIPLCHPHATWHRLFRGTGRIGTHPFVSQGKFHE